MFEMWQEWFTRKKKVIQINCVCICYGIWVPSLVLSPSFTMSLSHPLSENQSFFQKMRTFLLIFLIILTNSDCWFRWEALMLHADGQSLSKGVLHLCDISTSGRVFECLAVCVHISLSDIYNFTHLTSQEKAGCRAWCIVPYTVIAPGALGGNDDVSRTDAEVF